MLKLLTTNNDKLPEKDSNIRKTVAPFTFPLGGRMLREHFKIDHPAVFQSRNRMRGASRSGSGAKTKYHPVSLSVQKSDRSGNPHPPLPRSPFPPRSFRGYCSCRDSGGRQTNASPVFGSANVYRFVNASSCQNPLTYT